MTHLSSDLPLAAIAPRRGTGPRSIRATIVLGLLAGALACAPTQVPPPPGPPLRIGVFTDNPPIAFDQGGQLAGIEIDLASQLAPALNRELVLLPLGREELMPALLDGRIDVIMSGLTIPSTPDYRIAFGDAYLHTGLATVVRQPDAAAYDSPAAVMNTSGPVGVVAGSAAAQFVRQFPSARMAQYLLLEDAVRALQQQRVKLVVAEAHLLGWVVARNDGLAGVWALLDDNQLAWGFRVHDNTLRDAANAALDQWRKDGRLNGILRRWLPYWPGLG